MVVLWRKTSKFVQLGKINYMKRFIFSLSKSFFKAFRENEYIEDLRKRYPNFFLFLKKRLSKDGRYGLSFSLNVGLAIFIFLFFLGVAQDIVFRDPLVEADSRIMNLISSLRDIQTAKLFLFFTYLGNIQVIASLGVVVLLVLALSGKWRMAKLFFASVISGEFLYYFIKILIHRTRPDISFSLIPRDGYAFPSGHATSAMVFYGMLGFLLWHIFRKRWQKIFITLLVMGIIFMVGFSRIYLGVHWTSDVLAGWSLGLVILILFVAIYEERGKFYLEEKRKTFPPKHIAIITISLLFLESLFIYYFYTKHPLQFPSPQEQTIIQIQPNVSDFEKIILSNNFSKFSETLAGERMEPINFIIIGSKKQLVQGFQDSSWCIADDLNARRLLHLAKTAILNQEYLNAPVTPSFYNEHPNDIAFEKANEALTVRKRHHIRFWLTNFQYGNEPVWVATASFDKGIKYFVTHSIQPDIDTEREYIYKDLIKNGKVQEEDKIQLVSPTLGQNQSGDQFFSDGETYILTLE